MPKNLLYLKLLFPTKYKITFITVFSLDFIGLLLGLFIRDFSFFIIVCASLLFKVIIHLASSSVKPQTLPIIKSNKTAN